MNTKQLRQKILDLAIRGQLVPQDSSDEPASVLLEKIRAEKQTLIEQKKIKKDKKSSYITCDLSPYQKYTEHFADGSSKDITDEIPFDIPENWAWCRLEEIGEIITGNTPSKSNKEYYGNKYPFFKPTDLDSGYFVTEAQDNLSIKGFEISRKLPIKSILVTCIGATIGKTGFIRREGTCNQQINAIIASKLIFSEYIYLLCISPYFQNEIIKNASATTLPIINKSKFEKLFLPLPPLSEQRRIIEKIEELLALVDDLEVNKTDLQSYIKQAKSKVLEMAVRGELVPQNPEDEPASVLLERIKKEQKSSKSKGKTTEHNTHYEEELPFDIPKNWVWCRLGEVCDFIRNGITIKQSKEARGYPITRIETISKGNIDRNRMGYANILDISSFEKYILQQYDILLSHINSPMHIGKTAIYIPNDKEERIIHGMNLLCIRFKKGLNAIYLNYFFNSKIFKNAILPYIKNAVNQASINISSIEKIIIPLPPLTEQKRIVEKIEEIFSELGFIEENLI